MDIPVYHCAISCEGDSNFDSVKNTVDHFLRDWLRLAGTDKYLGFITESSKNFRIARAFTWPYKGHRKGKNQPKWYSAIREYVMEHWHCQNMVGVEADDALTIAAEVLKSQGYTPIIVTEDKDLLQWPGLHYNKNKSQEVFEISEEQGFINLWTQVITGDRTDHIPGVSQAAHETTTGTYNESVKADESLSSEERKALYKRYSHLELYGPAGALKYLEAFDLEEWPMRVWELYVDKYEYPEDLGDYGTQRFLETFDLIFMLRECPKDLEINYTIREPPVDLGILSLFEDYN